VIKKEFNKILILGSGALKIGEAGEFDYSGSQAIKALKQENIKTVLVNPNIATIQTSEGFADEVYFLPVTPYFIEKIIEKEHPDGILLSFGGQTALNCGVELNRRGILEKYNVAVLGTPVSVIENTEDRKLFAEKLSQIDVKTPKSVAVSSIEQAIKVANDIGFPVMIRIAYALGGLGSGVCVDEKTLSDKANIALSHADQILVEEFLEGWKEVEYEIVQDSVDNCIAVCNMENFDPLGIHTGESIVVAPSQTLTNEEYHSLRETSIRIVRHLGIIGECNVQFALHPRAKEYRVIEVNARLSRSSALASKATGYPLAFVAAKIALGYTLPEIPNSVTGITSACFEPALDYIVVKVPRWDLSKFRNVSKLIDSGMKSVGEVMSIGRSFEEALQKSLRMLDISVDGLTDISKLEFTEIENDLKFPTNDRIFAVYNALTRGFPIQKIYELSHINPWFIAKIGRIAEMELILKKFSLEQISKELLISAKQLGFSDLQIARAINSTEEKVREIRIKHEIIPKVKQIDTLAAEFPAKTNYLYCTYHGSEDDVKKQTKRSVMVLGSGAYRIGSSVEFDWCSVNTVQALKRMGFSTIMLNCNPETVSTDFDECDRLYFEELTLERVLDIYEHEQPIGIILGVGGQVANNLALKLAAKGVNILGTSAESIDMAEDRHKFSKLLDQLSIIQPEWKELKSVDEALKFTKKVSYPVLIRPSYVLSGAAMAVAMNDEELTSFLKKASLVSAEHPVVISKFIMGAKEVELDGVAKQGELIAYVISEHVENAGVHSGDATMVVPPQRTYLETIRQIKKIASKIAKSLNINGPFNVQFLAKNNDVSVIECNLRASRSFPFVSKVCNTNLIDIATKVMIDWPIPEIKLKPFNLEFVGVKAPQFSFTRLKGADPTLSVEMASTGEVGCLGADFEEAFLKAMIAVGFKLPVKNILLSTGPSESKIDFLPAAKAIQLMNIKIFATQGTADFLVKNNIKAEPVLWPSDNASNSADQIIKERKVDLVINIPKNYNKDEISNGYLIRRAAADFGVPLITNIQLAKRFIESISKQSLDDLKCKTWNEYLEDSR